MQDWFRAATGAVVDSLFPPDPASLRLIAALRTTLAAILTFAVIYALGFVSPLDVTDRVLGIAIALFASASVRDPTPRARLVTIALTPLAALAAAIVAALASHRFGAEAVALLMVVFAATYGAARGPRWASLGNVALIAFFFSVVSQPPPETLPTRFFALCVAAASVAFVRFLILPEHPETELGRLRRAIGAAAARILDWIASAVTAGQWRRAERTSLRREVSRLADMTAMAQARQKGIGERLLVMQLAIEQTARLALVNLGQPSDREPVSEALSTLGDALRTGKTPAPLKPGISQLGVVVERFANYLGEEQGEEKFAPAPPTPPPSEDSALASASRAVAAAALAIVVSGALLPSRWYWAAFAAFAMFQGTRSRGESIAKEVQYFVGTFTGVVVGMFAGFLLAGHEALQLLAIMVAVFLAFQASGAAYGAMMFWLTIIIGLMFGLLGYFVPDLLILRLEETAIGAIAGIIVGLVLPMRSALTTRKAATKAFFQTLGRLVDQSVQSLIKRPPTPELPNSLIEIERTARALRAASSAELYGVTLASSHAVRVRLLVIDACEAWARDLGRVALFATEVANEGQAELGRAIDAHIQANVAVLIDAIGRPGRDVSASEEAVPPVALPDGPLDHTFRLLLRIDAALQHLQRN